MNPITDRHEEERSTTRKGREREARRRRSIPALFSSPGTRPAAWIRGKRGLALVLGLLTLHYALALTSVTDKSPTFDETIHVFGGYTYWQLDDYRIMPENGNLPMRLFGLALLTDRDRIEMPSRDQPAWARSRQWLLSHRFFFELGNDFRRLIFRGRAAAALVSIVVLLSSFASAGCARGSAGESPTP